MEIFAAADTRSFHVVHATWCRAFPVHVQFNVFLAQSGGGRSGRRAET